MSLAESVHTWRMGLEKSPFGDRQAHLAALGHPARVNTSPAGHGAFLLNMEWRKRIVADIRLTVDEGAAAVALAVALVKG